MKRGLLLCLWGLGLWPGWTAAAAETAGKAVPDQPLVIFVAGAPGEDRFASNLVRQATLWSNVCARAGARFHGLGLDEYREPGDRARLLERLAAESRETAAPLWLILAGHGTYDGQQARFNLRGPDLTPEDLAAALAPVQRPLVLINAASASAPFLPVLAGTNRVIITATRSGHEVNYTRFGDYLAESLADPAADLDQDGQISLLEAVLTAAARVAEFYRTESRLATEHALIEDNGDGRGTPPEWFRGVRAVKRPTDGAVADGARAHQICLLPGEAERALTPEIRARRDALELAVFRLREKAHTLAEEDYLNELEKLLLELARLLETANPGP